MITVPGAYAAWSSWCEAFGRGEDLPTSHLTGLDQLDSAELRARVMARLATAYQARRQRWVDQLQRDLRHVNPARTGALAEVLTIARSRLAPMAMLTRSPLLLPDLRAEMGSDLARTISEIQQELERMARRDPLTQRLMLPTIADYPLSFGLTTQAVAVQPQAAPRGRRVIV